MTTKLIVTIHFTKFVGGKKVRTWTEERPMITTGEGRRYIWWLKRKLPVVLYEEKFHCDIHVRAQSKIEFNLPRLPQENHNGGRPTHKKGKGDGRVSGAERETV